jgi:hypothetical protein
VIGVPLLTGAAAWLGAYLLDRVLREVEDRAVAHVRDTVHGCRCMWCPAEYEVTRRPGEAPPDEPPPGWLESRRWPGLYWCCQRCWAEHLRFDDTVGVPAGEAWDELLEADAADLGD